MAHRVDLDDDTLLLLDGHCDTKTQALIDRIKEKRAFDEHHAKLRAAVRPEHANDVVELREWTGVLEAALTEAHQVIAAAADSGDDTTPVEWLVEVQTTIEALGITSTPG
jgi:hypothetical protein